MTDSERAGRLEQLLEAGKRNGYVLYDDLDALLPVGCECGPELEEVLAAVERAGIEVVVEPGGGAIDEPETIEDISDAIYTDDPVRVYLHEVGRVPRLTTDAEVELGKVIGLGNKDAERAKKDLVEANLWQVVVIARRYTDRGLHILDLIQEGNEGLMKAAENFEYARGYKFSTYAGWLARRFIIRATLAAGRRDEDPAASETARLGAMIKRTLGQAGTPVLRVKGVSWHLC
jgi:RNA polymerase primary sigma factor